MFEPSPAKYARKILIDPKIRRRVEKFLNCEDVQKWPVYEQVSLKAGERLWSEEVLVPSEVIELVLLSFLNRELSADEKSFAQQYAGVLAWKSKRGCYRFEPDLEKELMAQKEFTQNVVLLKNLPAQCVVISVGGILPTFVYFDYDVRARQLQLCQIGLSRGGTVCFRMPIVGPLISDMLSPLNASAQQIKVFGYIMPQILHLCGLKLDHSVTQNKNTDYLVTRTGVIAC